VAEGWRRLYNDGLHNLYATPNIVKVIKSRRMRWEGHTARINRREMYTTVLSENLKGRDHSVDLRVDGKIRLEYISKEIRCECVDWIHLAQDRDQWRAPVNMVINLRVP
jgi:hypothetical protein